MQSLPLSNCSRTRGLPASLHRARVSDANLSVSPGLRRRPNRGSETRRASGLLDLFLTGTESVCYATAYREDLQQKSDGSFFGAKDATAE